MAKIARVGDAIDHGGTIVSGSPDTEVNGIPVARVGDTVNCAIHGPQIIVSGSDNLFDEFRPIARIGDRISCGAVIVEGSTDTINMDDEAESGITLQQNGVDLPQRRIINFVDDFNLDDDDPNLATTIEVTNNANVDLTDIENSIATNTGDIATNTDSIDSLAPQVSDNNAKVTNANHSGDVTGDGALTIQSVAIIGKPDDTLAGDDFILFSDTSDGGNLKRGLASEVIGGSNGGNSAGGGTIDYSLLRSVSGSVADNAKTTILTATVESQLTSLTIYNNYTTPQDIRCFVKDLTSFQFAAFLVPVNESITVELANWQIETGQEIVLEASDQDYNYFLAYSLQSGNSLEKGTIGNSGDTTIFTVPAGTRVSILEIVIHNINFEEAQLIKILVNDILVIEDNYVIGESRIFNPDFALNAGDTIKVNCNFGIVNYFISYVSYAI